MVSTVGEHAHGIDIKSSLCPHFSEVWDGIIKRSRGEETINYPSQRSRMTNPSCLYGADMPLLDNHNLPVRSVEAPCTLAD